MTRRIVIDPEIAQKRAEKEAEKKYKTELAGIKNRRNVTDSDLSEMQAESKYWNERLRTRKNLTEEENIEFEFHLKKKRLRIPKIQRMIMNHKKCCLDGLIGQLSVFGIDIPFLLFNSTHLTKSERQDYFREIRRLKDEIEFYKKSSAQHYRIMDQQFSIIKQISYGSEIQTAAHLRVVDQD